MLLAGLFLLAVSCAVHAHNNHCPPGFVHVGDYCYFLNLLDRSQIEARSFCLKLGVGISLPVFQDQNQLKFMLNWLRSIDLKPIWLGLHEKKQGGWFWDSGQAFNASWWAAGQPSGSDTAGVVLEDYTIHNYPEERAIRTLCQAPAHYPSSRPEVDLAGAEPGSLVSIQAVVMAILAALLAGKIATIIKIIISLKTFQRNSALWHRETIEDEAHRVARARQTGEAVTGGAADDSDASVQPPPRVLQPGEHIHLPLGVLKHGERGEHTHPPPGVLQHGGEHTHPPTGVLQHGGEHIHPPPGGLQHGRFGEHIQPPPGGLQHGGEHIHFPPGVLQHGGEHIHPPPGVLQHGGEHIIPHRHADQVSGPRHDMTKIDQSTPPTQMLQTDPGVLIKPRVQDRPDGYDVMEGESSLGSFSAYDSLRTVPDYVLLQNEFSEERNAYVNIDTIKQERMSKPGFSEVESCMRLNDLGRDPGTAGIESCMRRNDLRQDPGPAGIESRKGGDDLRNDKTRPEGADAVSYMEAEEMLIYRRQDKVDGYDLIEEESKS